MARSSAQYYDFVVADGESGLSFPADMGRVLAVHFQRSPRGPTANCLLLAVVPAPPLPATRGHSRVIDALKGDDRTSSSSCFDRRRPPSRPWRPHRAGATPPRLKRSRKAGARFARVVPYPRACERARLIPLFPLPLFSPPLPPFSNGLSLSLFLSRAEASAAISAASHGNVRVERPVCPSASKMRPGRGRRGGKWPFFQEGKNAFCSLVM